NSFTVIVNEVNTPPQIIVPGNQTINELTPLNVSASATDSDLPPNPLTFSLVNPPAGMTVNAATGAISWTPTEAQGPSTNLVTVVVTDYNQWAVNSQHLSATNSFTVFVNEVNTPPALTVPTNQVINELTTLNVTASATDSDIPANPLTFTLLSAPTNMTINATNGAISWTPTEAQGHSTNLITVVVTDYNQWAVNSQHLSDTNSFTVIVNEVNTAPLLTVPPTQTIDELTPLNVSVSATDSDIPPNPLTFTLLSAPTNMTINATNGAISWTPTEAQGPSTNLITVVVTDYNQWAVNSQHLSDTNSFTVIVNEVNTAPVLQSIPDQSAHLGTLFTYQAVATDSDIPTNTLTFSLNASPPNMTINASSGLISWTPSQDQTASYLVTVQVTDNGVPPLSAVQSFHVTVAGHAPTLTIAPFAGGLMQVTVTGDTGFSYQLQGSSDLANWTELLQFDLSVSPYPYLDPGSATNAIRFYRLKLAQ
ncbi:MAG TPA: putative Ig domain-containing protein, partial [Verrucomicrobiae bacterium]|nr:putative Ig domain-containing protein [Verrucomicrobiae bacterium]